MPRRSPERTHRAETAADRLMREAYEAQIGKRRATTRLFINDVTLRDGEQAPGNTMSEEEKLEIAQQLVRMGIPGIEAGFPIASPGDFRAVERIANEVGSQKLPRPSHESVYPRISGLARLKRKDIQSVLSAVGGAPHHGVHTFISTSQDQIDKFDEDIRKAGGRPGNLSSLIHRVVIPGIETEIPYIREQDPNAVIQFSLEDWTRTEESVSDEVILAAAQTGAHIINLPDTVGIAVPMQIVKRVAHVRKLLDEHGFQHVVISWHGHNDTGNAVANAHAALEAGAQQFEPTILGIGERAGNFSFEGFLAGLDANLHYYEEATGRRITDPIVRKQVMKTALLLSSILGKAISPEHPIVGENAFAHEAGIHQDGHLKAKRSGRGRRAYEVLVPERYGATSKLILGKHSGWGGIKDYLEGKQLPFREKDRQLFTDAVSATADRLQRRKGLSDSEVMEEAYYPSVIEITGGAYIADVTEIDRVDGKFAVRITTRDGEQIIGVASAKDEGELDAIMQGMKQIIPGVEMPRDGFHTRAVGEGSSTAAISSFTIRNGYEVTHSATHRDTHVAERTALIKAFNAMKAMDDYKAMMDASEE